MAITKQKLSASTNGKNILVGAVASGSATTIHTGVSGTSSWDEVYIYASNPTTSSISCSICWGGTEEPKDVQRVLLNPGQGRVLIVDGKLIQNSLVVSAYASVSGSINVDGFVNSIV